MTKSLVPYSKYSITRAFKDVDYLTPDQAMAIAEAALGRRKGERDRLLILVLFQTGLRISEALSLTPNHLRQHQIGTVASIRGKGGKDRTVRVPPALASDLLSYAYRLKLPEGACFFPINRNRALQIVHDCAKRAGISKRVYCHLFRHSNAIETLRQTGHPQALMTHLGHSSPDMTMRYLRKLGEEEALKVIGQVEF